MGLLSSLLGRGKAKSKQTDTPDLAQRLETAKPAPLQPVFVIGDLHGRVDLLERMLELIDKQIGNLRLDNPKLVFVGNLIDQGPASADVLKRMRELTGEFPDNIECLLGCHEQMCLDFLDAPVARQARWIKEGGAMTLQSFQITLPSASEEGEGAERVAEELRRAMGEETLGWMRARPTILSSGNLNVVHAAVDPRRAISEQTARVLTWGHPEFLSVPRTDGQWVAHGHYETNGPEQKDSRISVNSAGWRTGNLSAAMILPEGHVSFLQTAPAPSA